VTDQPPTRALTDADPRVRLSALESLRETAMSSPEDAALASVFAQAARDPDSGVRESALHSLRFFTVEEARDTLVAAAEDPALDSALRGVATESLSMTGTDERVEGTLLALLADPEPELRFWAAYSLGHLADASAIAPLESVLGQPDAEVPPFGTLHGEARAAIDAIRARAGAAPRDRT
jgi:HEAT repeat protein